MSSSFTARQLPTADVLKAQLLEDHRKKSKVHRKNGVLYTFCPDCLTTPRSLILSLQWVNSHAPFLKEVYDSLPGHLRNALRMSRGNKDDETVQLAWCIREADHLEAANSAKSISLAKKYFGNDDINQFLDLTFLPPFEEDDLKMAQHEMRSSTNRPYASRKWQSRGLNRLHAKLITQGFWIASGVPLAQRLRTTVVVLLFKGFRPTSRFNMVRNC
jgi:hypothetical protein